MVKSVTMWVRRSAVVMIILLYSIVCSVPALGSPTFVASRNSDVYHVSSCSYVDRIKESNIIYFSSAEEAEASGRRGCSRCNPGQYRGSTVDSSQSSGSGSSSSDSYSDGYDDGYEDGKASVNKDITKEKDKSYKSGYDAGVASAKKAAEKESQNEYEKGKQEGITEGKRQAAEQSEATAKERYDAGYQTGYEDGAGSKESSPGGYILTGLGCLVLGAGGATLFIKKEEFTEWVRD